MSGLMKSTMGLEVDMDDDFEFRISNILNQVERNFSGVARCELRRVAESNSWIIECFWNDRQAMHAHFSSCQLQDLVGVLVSRSRKIVFECDNE